MAKKKSQDLEEQVEEITFEEEVVEDVETIEEDEAAEVLNEEVAVEEEEPAEVLDKEVAEIEEDASAGGEDDDGKDDEDKEEEEEEKPRGRTTGLTMTLCVLNILAVCAFAFLLLMNYEKRQRWAYANLMHGLAIIGIPLKEEDKGPTASQLVRDPVVLNAKQIANAQKKRSVTVAEKDILEVNESLKLDISPDMLTEKILKDHFSGGVGSPSKNLEEEVGKVKGDLPTKVEEAAKEIAEKAQKKSEADKRKEIKRILLPMAFTTSQIELAAKKIDTAKPDELESLLVDAAQRKMYFDLLRVLQVYRHWDLKDPFLEQVVDSQAVPLEKVKELVNERFDDVVETQSRYGIQRESTEKRDNIGFLLVAVNNLRKPPDAELLYPREKDATTKQYAISRAEVVLGLMGYTKAVNTLAAVLRRIQDIADEKLARDRDGTFYQQGKDLEKVPGFTGKYTEQTERLTELVANIENRKKRIGELKQQLTQTQEVLKDRKINYDLYVTKVLEAKKATENLVQELKRLENQLFVAQRELAGISELNRQMEIEIFELEQKLAEKQP